MTQQIWRPVDFVVIDKDENVRIFADQIAMTIGKGDTALATHAWPDDGKTYAICTLTPVDEASRVAIPDEVVEALTYILSTYGDDYADNFDDHHARWVIASNWLERTQEAR